MICYLYFYDEYCKLCIFYAEETHTVSPAISFNNAPNGMVGSILYMCSCAMNNDISKVIIFFFFFFFFFFILHFVVFMTLMRFNKLHVKHLI